MSLKKIRVVKIRKALKKVRHKLGLTGAQLKKRLGLGKANSAQSVQLRGDSIYGQTGSIIGRF